MTREQQKIIREEKKMLKDNSRLLKRMEKNELSGWNKMKARAMAKGAWIEG